MGKKICLVPVLSLLAYFASADVADPSHVNKQFQFVNLDKFPAFRFYFLHQGYHYNMGHQPNPPDTVFLENNKSYKVSERNADKSVLLARDQFGKFSISGIKIGGAETVGESITGIVEVYSITGIKKGVIKIKKLKEVLQYPGGIEKERKSNFGISAFLSESAYTNGLALASAIALSGLAFLFFYRNSKPKYIPLSN